MAPSKVKVGPNWFDLHISKEKWRKVPDKEGMAGWTDLYSHVIYVDPNMAPNLIKITAVHEVLHALFDDSGITWPVRNKDVEETIIRVLAPRLWAFIVDNPEFMEWINGREETSE